MRLQAAKPPKGASSIARITVRGGEFNGGKWAKGPFSLLKPLFFALPDNKLGAIPAPHQQTILRFLLVGHS